VLSGMAPCPRRIDISSILNQEELPQQCEESLTEYIHRKDGEIVVIIETCHCYQLHTKLCQALISQGLTLYIH
jgi:hypothetical protein